MKLAWFKKIGIGILILLSIELLVDISVPGFVSVIETFFNQPLSFESVLRVYLFSYFFLTLVIIGLGLRHTKKNNLNGYYVGYCIWFLVLVFIFALDRHHRLFEEYSWIRYSTAFSLFAASSCLAYAAYALRKEFSRTIRSIFVFLGGVFLFVGLDELLQIHEGVGNIIEKKAQIPHVFTDYITIVYALAGLLFIVGFFWWFRKLKEKNSYFLFFLCFGIGAYLFSTALDTFDVSVLNELRKLAVWLSLSKQFIFSDIWYPIWSVKNSLNGLEEVLEYLAAFSFFTASLALILNQKKCELWKKIGEYSWQKNTCCIVTVGVFSIIGIGIIFSFPLLTTKTPLTNSLFGVSRIASAHEGLFHVDDLFYHPSWGVLIADEGSRGIYQWNEGELIKLSDPQKKIVNADSVTATGSAVFVSDPEAGIIFSYTKKDGFIPLWTRADGLVQPEGIVVAGDTLYVLDESQKSITKLKKGTKAVIWKPEHPQFQAPEDIAVDPLTKKLFVTDDVTGAIFEVDFGKEIKKIAELPKPESITRAQDGSLFVSDTRWGAVFKIVANRTSEKIFQMQRNYRDVQGIAIDRENNFFVSTSDGYGSSSFMPSFVFKIIKN